MCVTFIIIRYVVGMQQSLPSCIHTIDLHEIVEMFAGY